MQTWLWMEPQRAAKAALKAHPAMEKLRQGHSLLSLEQFADALANKEMEVLVLPNACAALICWGACAEGKTMNILTTLGDMEHAQEALTAMEAAAQAEGTRMIISIGRRGYTQLMRANGYYVELCILMKKVLP